MPTPMQLLPLRRRRPILLEECLKINACDDNEEAGMVVTSERMTDEPENSFFV